MWLTLLRNKYAQMLLLSILVAIGAFYKGYSVKSDEVELQGLKDYKILVEKLDKVYEYSSTLASKAKVDLTYTNKKLNTIINSIDNSKLTSVPCTPTEDFTSKWNEINNALSFTLK